MALTHRVIGASVLCVASIAGAATCYITAPPVSCCSLVASYDPVGNCSPWAHHCPDIAISNPIAQQIMQVGQNQGGSRPPQNATLTCTYQPRTCNFIGCSNAGPVASGGCLDQVPGSIGCPEGPPA